MAKLKSISNPDKGVYVKGTYLTFDSYVLPEDCARFASNVYANKLRNRGLPAQPLFTEPQVVQPEGNLKAQRLREICEPHTCETYLGAIVNKNMFYPFILVSEFDCKNNNYDHILTLRELSKEKRKEYKEVLDGTEKRMFDSFIGKDITAKL